MFIYNFILPFTCNHGSSTYTGQCGHASYPNAD